MADGSKPKELTSAFCYFCGKAFPEIKEIRNGRKFARKVAFCDSRCFGRYLAANRPIVKIPEGSSLDIAQRAAERLEEMKADVLFSPPDAVKSLVDEEIIYELTFIVEGKEIVTKGERYGCYAREHPAAAPVLGALRRDALHECRVSAVRF